jgi:hypothetical protein
VSDERATGEADWAEKLHELADAARVAVLAAGWRVRAVCVVVSPADEGVPDFVLTFPTDKSVAATRGS